MIKLAVIIPAAGSGTRMGSRLPKPFIELMGAPILEHTIRSFVEVGIISQILIATSKEWFGVVEKIFQSFSEFGIDMQVVEGGEERQYSIHNAISHIRNDIDLIAVHDAVRPFVKKSQIEQCCTVALEAGGSILAVPAKDTIKKVDEHFVIESTPDRSVLWQAQTPQVFKKDLLISSYKSALESGYLGTDDASLVERFGGQVKVVEGDRENLKITYPIDLEVAKLILRMDKK